MIVHSITAQYNYGLDICDFDARIEGKIDVISAPNSIFIGHNAGINTDVINSNRNTFVGYQAGQSNTSAFGNTYVGFNAGFSNGSPTGERNTAIGSEALENNQSQESTAVGHQSLRFNTTGYANTAFGSYSLNANTIGSANVGIGGASLGSLVSGSNNVAIGQWAYGFTNTTGSNNVSIGHRSGFNAVGTGNIFIGFNAGHNETGSNKLYIENSNSSSPLVYGDFSSNDVRINGNLCYTGTIGTCSDINYKRNISPITDALTDIIKLNGIKHEWRHDEFPDMIWKQGSEFGLIAQEVNELFPELVNEDKDGYLYVDYAKLTPILIEAMKEQQKQITELRDKVKIINNLSSEIKGIHMLLSSNSKLTLN